MTLQDNTPLHQGAFVIIAPNSMAFRAIINSQVLPELKKQMQDYHYSRIMILSPNDGSQQQLPKYVEWRDFMSPLQKTFAQKTHSKKAPLQKGQKRQPLAIHKKIIRVLSTRLSCQFGLGYANTVFRFNQLQHFFAHQFKQGMNKERRKREELAGNFVSKKYGFPFPNSKKLYQLIYHFYYSPKQVTDPNISAFFEAENITKLVFWHVQNSIFREYSICARNNNIPYTAVIGSWDRPTTKGPICPACDKYIVNSVVMRDELINFHGIDSTLIEVVGWPQMDVYHSIIHQAINKQHFQQDHDTFLKSLDIDPKNSVLLYAGNASRLGAHEPSIVEHIAEKLQSGLYSQKDGKRVHLLIRPHPQDVDWQTRYSHVQQQENVTLMPAQMGNIETMVNTLIHSDIVIATQGSITLDAAALDKKIINIAFDGKLNRSYTESVARWYEMDHYRPVVASQGVAIVKSFAQLDDTIVTLLEHDPHANGRAYLRKIELEPFQGDSSSRQVQAML